MPSPLAFGDCGGVLDCGLRPGVNANTVDVNRAVFDYRTGIVMLDGRRFPCLQGMYLPHNACANSW
ncbi:hypothetical protein D2E44_02605 [Mycobacteroides abscessus]|nr:hypothetical protein D2E44_02605 [Mycobacteroides abscessus]